MFRFDFRINHYWNIPAKTTKNAGKNGIIFFAAQQGETLDSLTENAKSITDTASKAIEDMADKWEAQTAQLKEDSSGTAEDSSSAELDLSATRNTLAQVGSLNTPECS